MFSIKLTSTLKPYTYSTTASLLELKFSFVQKKNQKFDTLIKLLFYSIGKLTV